MNCLRIAITSDPEIPVPPSFYGGIERIIDMLLRGLVERGHDVTLFAHPDSKVPCRLEPYSGLRSRGWNDLFKNMWQVTSRVLTQKYDLVHSFGRLAYLLPLLALKIPKIMSFQRPITPRSVIWGNRLSQGSLHFTALSRHIMKEYQGRKNWHLVYNGAPRKAYRFQKQVKEDAPVVFLGRIEWIKGPHLAIEVARSSGRKLVIAGNVPNERKHQDYFRECIAPFLNGSDIQFVGLVTDEQKNEILGRAAALLMPVVWEEPFGIVMAEALACGTPVIGFNRGAIPEVVENGVNGFVCNSMEEMVSAVGRINEIDRRLCRQIMEDRFSDTSVTDNYERLYRKILEGRNGK